MRDEIEDYTYPNRTACGILADMRTSYETRNFSYLPGLIEELQYAATRMEAAIGDLRDISRLARRKSKLKAEVRRLASQVGEEKGEESGDE
jgi:hypothetical protein